MAAKTIEVLYRDIPNEIAQRLTRQFVLDEKPAMACYNSQRYFYYILTDRRLISVYVRSKYSDLAVTSVFLKDIVRIDENITAQFVGYKIFSVNQQEPIQVSLDGAGELAAKFGDMLYQMYNQAKLAL